jgi:hypothetical protein
MLHKALVVSYISTLEMAMATMAMVVTLTFVLALALALATTDEYSLLAQQKFLPAVALGILTVMAV